MAIKTLTTLEKVTKVLYETVLIYGQLKRAMHRILTWFPLVLENGGEVREVSPVRKL